ncbi:hypothetical protein A9P82_10465 [Arachidicoccus ginsenosidimutans]|nr:hypothetical protein A9P82_10465 [Arachidicoccus sp. BS20]
MCKICNYIIYSFTSLIKSINAITDNACTYSVRWKFIQIFKGLLALEQSFFNIMCKEEGVNYGVLKPLLRYKKEYL